MSDARTRSRTRTADTRRSSCRGRAGDHSNTDWAGRPQLAPIADQSARVAHPQLIPRTTDQSPGFSAGLDHATSTQRAASSATLPICRRHPFSLSGQSGSLRRCATRSARTQDAISGTPRSRTLRVSETRQPSSNEEPYRSKSPPGSPDSNGFWGAGTDPRRDRRRCGPGLTGC